MELILSILTWCGFIVLGFAIFLAVMFVVCAIEDMFSKNRLK